MNKEQINIAIAEAVGWKRFPRADDTQFNPPRWVSPDGEMTHTLVSMPDFCGSLDAIHEAEKVLKDVTANDEFARYCRTLSEMLCPIDCKGSSCGFTICATAAQRAEAFLRALSLPTE